MFAGTCPVSIDLFIKMLIGRHRAGCSDFNSFELLNTVIARTIFIFVGNLDCVLGNGGTVYLVLEFLRQTGCQYPINIHKTYLRSYQRFW